MPERATCIQKIVINHISVNDRDAIVYKLYVF